MHNYFFTWVNGLTVTRMGVDVNKLLKYYFLKYYGKWMLRIYNFRNKETTVIMLCCGLG